MVAFVDGRYSQATAPFPIPFTPNGEPAGAVEFATFFAVTTPRFVAGSAVMSNMGVVELAKKWWPERSMFEGSMEAPAAGIG